MADLIKVRRDTAANWASANPVLADGEMGLEKGTLKFKFGDGTTAWNSLAYAGGSTSGTSAGGNIYRIVGTGTPQVYVMTSVPARSVVPFRDYMGTTNPSLGSYGFDATLDTWNGQPLSFASTGFTPADRAWMNLFDRTTPGDEMTYVYDTGAPDTPWSLKPYQPAGNNVLQGAILNSGDAIPSGLLSGVVFDRDVTAGSTTPAVLGSNIVNSSAATSNACPTTAALAVGDWVIVNAEITGSAAAQTVAMTPPAGVTAARINFQQNAAVVVAQWVCKVTAAVASGANFTVTTDLATGSGSESMVQLAKMQGLSGDTTTVVDQVGVAGTGSGNNLAVSTPATTQANDILFAVFGFNPGNPIVLAAATPSGWTQLGSTLATSDTAPRAMAVYYRMVTTTGAQTVTEQLAQVPGGGTAVSGMGGALMALKLA